MAELTAYGFNKAMTIDNIRSGFRATGIYPYDPKVFSEDAFWPSKTLQNDTELAGSPEIAAFKLPKASVSNVSRRKRTADQAQILTVTPESTAKTSGQSCGVTAKQRNRRSL